MIDETAGYTRIGPWREPSSYRGALALPVSADGRILLQLRDDKLGIVAPGAWSLFGGEIEPGESPPAAAARELLEETGIALPVAAFTPAAAVMTPPPRNGLLFVHLVPLTAAVCDIRVAEGSGFGLVTRTQYDKLDVLDYMRPVIDRIWALIAEKVTETGR